MNEKDGNRRTDEHRLANVASLIRRMKLIEGQARGIQRLLEEGKDCQSIVIQLSAMKSALNKVALSIMGCYITEQVSQEILRGGTGEETIKKAIELFSTFS